jgi:hypothetical protein
MKKKKETKDRGTLKFRWEGVWVEVSNICTPSAIKQYSDFAKGRSEASKRVFSGAQAAAY